MVVIQVVAGGLYQLGVQLWPTNCPQIAILIPIAISIVVRLALLCLGRWWRRMPVMQAESLHCVLGFGMLIGGQS